jgi:hypothetical protein
MTMLIKNGVVTRSGYIFKNVLEAMQEADEIGGVEDPNDYLTLMEAIRHEAVQRYNNCADHVAWTAERFEPAKEEDDE